MFVRMVLGVRGYKKRAGGWSTFHGVQPPANLIMLHQHTAPSVWGQRAYSASIYGRLRAVRASRLIQCGHPFCGVVVAPGEVYALGSLFDVLASGPTRLCAGCSGLTPGEGGAA